MRAMLTRQQAESSKPVKENRHKPMTVDEAIEYTHIPRGTMYMKLEDGTIPATKPGRRWIQYQDELDKWLETKRRNVVPLTADEENAAILASHKRKPNKSSWQTDPLTTGTTLAGKVTNIEFNTQDNQRLTLEEVVTAVTVRAKTMEKCATPAIAYDKGELVFSCETEGVKFFSEVKVADAKSNEGERLQLIPTYEISVYATKEGYSNSDEAMATIQWRDGRPLLNGFSSVTTDGKAAADANGDGAVDVADIATIISEMAARTRRTECEDWK